MKAVIIKDGIWTRDAVYVLHDGLWLFHRALNVLHYEGPVRCGEGMMPMFSAPAIELLWAHGKDGAVAAALTPVGVLPRFSSVQHPDHPLGDGPGILELRHADGVSRLTIEPTGDTGRDYIVLDEFTPRPIAIAPIDVYRRGR